MASSFVDAIIDGEEGSIVIQGFREYGGLPSYVYIGILGESETFNRDTTVTPENAHVLSEEIRKHAEFSLQPAEEQGE